MTTLELQLASFGACVACRGVRTLSVTVDKRMPLSLWGDNDSLGKYSEAPERRRLPVLRATAVEWMMPAGMLVPMLSKAELLRGVEWMQLTGVDCGEVHSKATPVYPWNNVSLPATRLVHSPRSYFEAMLKFIEQEELAIDTIPVSYTHLTLPTKA